MKKELFFLREIIFVISAISMSCQGNNTVNPQFSNAKNEKVKQIKKEVIIDDYLDALSSKTEICYDTNGRITDEFHYDKENKISDRYLYAYNKYGEKVLWEIYRGESDLGQKTEYIYDGSRKLVKEICKIYSDYKVSPDICISNHFYDSKGRLIRSDLENFYTTRHEFRYDKNNKLVEKIYYNSDGSKDLEFFDDNGNKKSDSKNSYKYDEMNNLIEEVHDYPDNYSKFTVMYKYNEYGNWIERQTYYSNDRRHSVALRGTEIKTIYYYP